MTTTQKELPLPSGLVTQSATLPTSQPVRPSYAQLIASGYEHGLTPEALGMLVAAQREDDDRAARAAYNAAIAKFQSLCPTVHKSRQMGEGGGGMNYQYADYSDVMTVAKPHLDACGLAISFSFPPTTNGLQVVCRVSHGSYHENHTPAVPVPSQLRVTDTQRYGAAVSYAKRYCLTAALNIITDDLDDDAAGLCETISEAECRAIEQLLIDSNSDVAAFCRAYQIAKVSELPLAQLSQARSQIIRKMEKAKQG